MIYRLFTALALLVAFAFTHELAAADKKRTMSMTGMGEVRAKPDLAIVRVGVLRQARTAREALTANNADMTGILAALKEQGIAEKDLQTSEFAVHPRYNRKDKQNPNQIIGYQVSNQLSVTIRDLEKLGQILDLVVSLGSNQIFGVSFSIAEPRPLRDEARKLATKDAIRKAKLFAEAADVELGPVMSITESGGIRPPVPVRARAMAMSPGSEAVPTAVGQQAVNAQVNIVWELR